MTNGRLCFYHHGDNLFLIYSSTSSFFPSVTKDRKIPSLDLCNFFLLLISLGGLCLAFIWDYCRLLSACRPADDVPSTHIQPL